MKHGTILISGGSRGLGFEIVEHLLAQGQRVATFAQNATPETDRLAAAHSDRFLFRAADMAQPDSLEPLMKAVEAWGGPVTGLVNNAAIGQDHLLANMPPSKLAEVLQINLVSTILLTRLVVRGMLRHGAAGRIVSVSSICGSRGYPGLAAYSATKAGLDGFTRSLARELGGRGILVNAVAPGFFESEMSRILSAEQLETIRRRSATGKLTLTPDILPVLDLLLLGDANITGQVIAIDGEASL